jgi:hypothetical protein
VQEFYGRTIAQINNSNSRYSRVVDTLESGTEVKIENLMLYVKKAALEMKDGTNILGLIVFCTVFGVILGQLGPEGK